MTQEFDRLIGSATPIPPDSGPHRRAAWVRLRDRMRAQRQRETRQRRWGVSLVAVVIFALVGTFQIKPLGGDGFDFDTAEVPLDETTSVTVIKNKLGTRGFSAPPGASEADIREIQQQLAANEGTIENLTAYSFDGRPPHWLVSYRMVTNGTSRSFAKEPVDLSVENHPPERASLQFFLDHEVEFENRIESGQIPSQPYADIRANGVMFRVRKWSQEYPGWGIVTYYRGLPLIAPEPQP